MRPLEAGQEPNEIHLYMWLADTSKGAVDLHHARLIAVTKRVTNWEKFEDGRLVHARQRHSSVQVQRKIMTIVSFR